MLENLGYKVTGFTDGREALKVFSEKPSEFDLVITDYMMPHLTGVDIAQKMIGIRSDIPIILCTGYSDLISSEKAIAIGFRELILKPFNHQDFAELVRRVLDQKEPGDK
jgi:DNA-binding NtrC family response regulator